VNAAEPRHDELFAGRFAASASAGCHASLSTVPATETAARWARRHRHVA